jgi:hypothetical protein
MPDGGAPEGEDSFPHTDAAHLHAGQHIHRSIDVALMSDTALAEYPCPYNDRPAGPVKARQLLQVRVVFL